MWQLEYQVKWSYRMFIKNFVTYWSFQEVHARGSKILLQGSRGCGWGNEERTNLLKSHARMTQFCRNVRNPVKEVAVVTDHQCSSCMSQWNAVSHWCWECLHKHSIKPSEHSANTFQGLACKLLGRPAKLRRAFSSALKVSTSKSLVGSSSRSTFPCCRSTEARCNRFLSPPASDGEADRAKSTVEFMHALGGPWGLQWFSLWLGLAIPVFWIVIAMQITPEYQSTQVPACNHCILCLPKLFLKWAYSRGVDDSAQQISWVEGRPDKSPTFFCWSPPLKLNHDAYWRMGTFLPPRSTTSSPSPIASIKPLLAQ